MYVPHVLFPALSLLAVTGHWGWAGAGANAFVYHQPCCVWALASLQAAEQDPVPALT